MGYTYQGWSTYSTVGTFICFTSVQVIEKTRSFSGKPWRARDGGDKTNGNAPIFNFTSAGKKEKHFCVPKGTTPTTICTLPCPRIASLRGSSISFCFTVLRPLFNVCFFSHPHNIHVSHGLSKPEDKKRKTTKAIEQIAFFIDYIRTHVLPSTLDDLCHLERHRWYAPTSERHEPCRFSELRPFLARP